jgi:hypothetical protein
MGYIVVSVQVFNPNATINTVACTSAARKWLSGDHVGIPTDANATADTETEERCFLFVPCRKVISWAIGAMS